MGDEEGVPAGQVYTVFTFSRTQSLAQAMSHDHRPELMAETQPAGPKAEAIPTPQVYGGPPRTSDQVAA